MRCFLSLLAFSLLRLSLPLTMASAHPHGHPTTFDNVPYPDKWEIDDLLSGNQRFVRKVHVEYPGLLEKYSQKQDPPFMHIGCVDSR